MDKYEIRRLQIEKLKETDQLRCLEVGVAIELPNGVWMCVVSVDRQRGTFISQYFRSQEDLERWRRK